MRSPFSGRLTPAGLVGGNLVNRREELAWRGDVCGKSNDVIMAAVKQVGLEEGNRRLAVMRGMNC